MDEIEQVEHFCPLLSFPCVQTLLHWVLSIILPKKYQILRHHDLMKGGIGKMEMLTVRSLEELTKRSSTKFENPMSFTCSL